MHLRQSPTFFKMNFPLKHRLIMTLSVCTLLGNHLLHSRTEAFGILPNIWLPEASHPQFSHSSLSSMRLTSPFSTQFLAVTLPLSVTFSPSCLPAHSHFSLSPAFPHVCRCVFVWSIPLPPLPLCLHPIHTAFTDPR